MARPRKPMHLHLVEGTNRVDRHAPANEPAAQVFDTAPAPPSHLKPQAADCWHRLSGMLTRMAILTDADLLAFERLCTTWQEIQDLDVAIEMLGCTTYETTSIAGGFMRRSHPEIAQRADAERRFLGMLGQFGMTPSTRARLALPSGPSESKALSKYFG